MKNCKTALPAHVRNARAPRRTQIAAAIAVGIVGLSFSAAALAADAAIDASPRSHDIEQAVAAAFRTAPTNTFQPADAPMAFSRVWQRKPLHTNVAPAGVAGTISVATYTQNSTSRPGNCKRAKA